MFIFDVHLDLAMNALEWNRDLTRPLEEVKEREKHLPDKPDRGRATVTFPEMRQGKIGLCVATQIARYVKRSNPLPGWHSREQAWAQTQGQLAWYRAMEELGEMVQITDGPSLEKHLSLWFNPAIPDDQKPIGYILSLEGADSVLSPAHLDRAFAQGLRAIGPAHYGPGIYAQGTDATGGLGPNGKDLLRQMERLGIILDATHLCDDSFWEALSVYNGPVWASHSNCRTLVNHNRQFSDDQLKELIRRGAVIGAPLDAWMMIPGWVRGKTTPEGSGLTLEVMVNHIDHICQLAGTANHCGIGTDLDGAFGTEQTPMDVKTIANLQSLPAIFQKRGYSEEDIEKVMHRNFLDFLRRTWARTGR